MKVFLSFILLFFVKSISAQVVQRQMISSLAVNKKLSNGLVVNQTIGQQSNTHNFLIQHDFQQAVISKIVPFTSFMTTQTIKLDTNEAFRV